MKRASLILAVAVFVFAVIYAAQAQACSCAAPATSAKALKRATAVFRGKVIRISAPSLDRLGLTNSGAKRVRFEIIKQWKGPSAETALVVTRLTGEACGFPFEEQKEYLVYVVAEPKQVQTGICTGTKSVAEAEREMDELDELLLAPAK